MLRNCSPRASACAARPWAQPLKIYIYIYIYIHVYIYIYTPDIYIPGQQNLEPLASFKWPERSSSPPMYIPHMLDFPKIGGALLGGSDFSEYTNWEVYQFNGTRVPYLGKDPYVGFSGAKKLASSTSRANARLPAASYKAETHQVRARVAV